jgi:putative DNA primase/helicase
VRYVVGAYGVTVPPAFLMQSRRDAGSATPELAMLAGARVAFANEIEAGSRLSGQTVKTAVSTEHITARPLYGAPFTFAPTHKLFIRGNHRPIVTDDDEGIWRRIQLVPFELDVPASDRDPGLEAKLLTEAPGILRWMVDGFRLWKLHGLMPPKRVLDASLAYRRESDLIAQWIAEHCEVDPSFEVGQRQAYSTYRTWCSEQGLRQISKASFTRALGERGFRAGRESQRGDRQRLYIGLRLQDGW